MNRDPQTDPPVAPRRVVQCNACGRSADCTAEELLRYTRDGWPRCCGQVMAFYTEATRPAPAADSPDTNDRS
jgi:hypothetical protein